MSMIKAVIFDVDGVLIDSFEANLKFHQDLLKLVGYPILSREMYSKMFHMTMLDVIRESTKLKDEKEINRIWEMGKNRVVQYPSHLITTPENYERVIEKLNNKYILAIVTSRIRGGIFKLPQLAKFENYFKTVVYYEDTQKHKPDPQPLLLAVKRLGIKPNEAVYIGDALTDIQAAKAAGMKIIIYSKDKLLEADRLTSEFDKLPNAIESLT